MYFGEMIEEPMSWEIKQGFFEEKLLQLDILGPNNVFSHFAILDHSDVEYSVITEVPSELYVINEIDFLTLEKGILNEFRQY